MTTPLPPQPVVPRPSGKPEKEHWDYEEVYVRGDKGSFLALGVIAGVVVLFIMFFFGVRSWIETRIDPPGEPGDVVELTLERGDSSGSIANLLEDNGVIPSATVYGWYIRLKGGVEFQAGDFEFRENMSISEVLGVLEEGPVRVALAPTLSVTLPEGLTIEQIATRIDDVEGLTFDGNDFLRQLRNGRYRSDYGPPLGALEPDMEEWEGLLFPDTYSLLAESTPDDLITLLIDNMNAVGDRLGLYRSQDRVGLTPYETLIVASLIEEEAKVEEDRAKIARVIYNRLEAGWPLGIDATIVYFTGDNVLLQSELETDSPYNTRLRQGLPPTPIASPGEKSIEAALNPADGEWMYYVLTSTDGTHSFSETAEQFEADKQICIELDLGCGP